MAENKKKRIRNKLIQVWVSPSEYSIAEQKATLCKRNISELMRGFIVDGVIINYEPFDIKEVCTAINKIGSNINQIARRVNECDAVQQDDIDELKSQYDKLLDVVVEKVLGVE